ncbi:MAG: ribonuclease H-like domain-containing protein [Propionibacteriales bacterium]|nr:ribonuclease H-like domain-containing protein [Propionibacteriales bacterium]
MGCDLIDGVQAEAPDYSGIRPLGAYPATRCPVRLQYDLLPPPGTVRVEAPATQQDRMEQGIAFEQAVLEELVSLHPDAVLVPANWRAAQPTLEAMRAGAPLILGGALPDDLVGRRSGRPDLLVRVDGGYLPGDVKLHGITEAKPGPARWSSLADPWPEAATEEPDLRLKADREHDDALQLAHYWRMLEQLGYAAPGPARGVVLDRRQRLWWIDLDVPRRKVWWQEEPATWLEVYDHEFAFRRDIALHTQRRIDGEELPPKVVPVWVSECRGCPWREVCRAELVEVDHVSLLPGSTWDRFVEHRRRDVLTRRDVALLDVPTAVAVDELSDAMWRKVEDADPEVPLGALLDKRPLVVAALGAVGFTTGGELMAHLDERTASYRTAKVGKLLPLVDDARAVVADVPHRRRGATALDLPPAAVEVDIDMECDQEGLNYLWGVLPTVAGEMGAYVAIDCYDELTDQVEAAVFLRMLDHLAERRAEATRLGGELRVYHWTAAELTAMRRIVAKAVVPGLPSAAELEAMIAAEWVDLAVVHRNAVLTGRGNGLKDVATAIGFAWDVDDPGGYFSILQHTAAVAGDPAAVDWLRSYNRSDVLATSEVRRWLREEFDRLPRIEDWVEPQ